MSFLRTRSASHLEQRVDGLLPVTERRSQLLAPLVARTQDLAQRHRFACQVCGDGAAQKFILVEHPDLAHLYRELRDEIVHRIARSQVRAGLAVSAS
ncbi:MAG: hypothetical protein ACJ72H_21060 [Candidatus Sulfotelmatobacter sp.]